MDKNPTFHFGEGEHRTVAGGQRGNPCGVFLHDDELGRAELQTASTTSLKLIWCRHQTSWWDPYSRYPAPCPLASIRLPVDVFFPLSLSYPPTPLLAFPAPNLLYAVRPGGSLPHAQLGICCNSPTSRINRSHNHVPPRNTRCPPDPTKPERIEIAWKIKGLGRWPGGVQANSQAIRTVSQKWEELILYLKIMLTPHY